MRAQDVCKECGEFTCSDQILCDWCGKEARDEPDTTSFPGEEEMPTLNRRGRRRLSAINRRALKKDYE